jgi:hypothetical protein
MRTGLELTTGLTLSASACAACEPKTKLKHATSHKRQKASGQLVMVF